MNPPTDPLSLLVYGIAVALVFGTAKLWDRRRDAKAKQALAEAQQRATQAEEHASTAAEHAGVAAAAAGRLEQRTPATGRITLGQDTGAMLLRMLLRAQAEQPAELPDGRGRHRA